MNTTNNDMSIVQKAISFFRKGDYASAKACYIEASAIFGEHLFINNIKICDLRLHQPDEGALSLDGSKKIKLKNIILEKDKFHFITELDISDSKDLLEIELESEVNSHGIKFLILFEFFGVDGNILKNVQGIGVSAAYDKHFRYFVQDSVLDVDYIKYFLKTQFPLNVRNCKIYVATVGQPENSPISINLNGHFIAHNYTIDAGDTLKIELPLYQDVEIAHKKHDPIIRTTKNRSIEDLNIACILDEFTTECLDHEVNLIKLTQENWLEELKSLDIDFLLVESCWRGNNNNWGTLTKGSGGAGKLAGLLKFCNSNGVPTVFWNKEDPPHYDKFAPVAKFFDQVITTDINMISRYKKDHNIDAYPLSFAAQPKIHNPNSKIQRLNKAVFAGSYYGDKPKRCSDFNQLMKQLKQANINYDIYDRNYSRDIEKFKFPKEYRKHVLGSLPASDVWKAHQGYKYQINMNTVQDSRTMFARRVYESLASGTPVISNASLGVKELFGDLVLFSGHRTGLVNKLRELERSPDVYKELAKSGVRRVMRNHTYGHRIQEICSLLGINVEVVNKKSSMSIAIRNESEIEKAIALFSGQTAPNKHLYLLLDNFESAHTYLNKSTDQVSYIMGFAKELYSQESDLYNGSLVLDVDISSDLSKEALEDFSYWGRVV